jgi:hypothetical protein
LITDLATEFPTLFGRNPLGRCASRNTSGLEQNYLPRVLRLADEPWRDARRLSRSWGSLEDHRWSHGKLVAELTQLLVDGKRKQGHD